MPVRSRRRSAGVSRDAAAPPGLAAISALALGVGVASGLGAAAFRELIAFFHNLFFLGRLSLAYDANVHTPDSPWGIFAALVPVAGALGVVFLVKTFAPEAKGSGVPEVIDAVYYRRGLIRPVVAVIKPLASALGIGSGASVGREGPILQIGSAFGSAAGRLPRVQPRQRLTLIAAGAGGGIAATFNTPLGGMLFAMELILHEVSVRTLVPIMVAAAAATYVGQLFFGVHPSFLLPVAGKPDFYLETPWMFAAYLGLGILAGLASTLFIKAAYAFEDGFSRLIRRNPYLRHAAGMLAFGAGIVLLKSLFGHYYIEGVGYATVQDVLSGRLAAPGLLVLLFATKLLATALALGSGGSGGIFSPGLVMGSTLGAGYGLVLSAIFPGLGVDLTTFALAGMAGFVGGATGAALAAAVMTFEMTLDFNVVVPVVLAVASSYGLRKLLCKESFYTMKLARRGHAIPEALEADLLRPKRAGESMERAEDVDLSDPPERLKAVLAGGTPWVLVRDGKRMVGIVARDAAAGLAGVRELAEIASRSFIVARESDALLDVIARMSAAAVSAAVVLCEEEAGTAGAAAGVVTRERAACAFEGVEGLFPRTRSGETGGISRPEQDSSGRF